MSMAENYAHFMSFSAVIVTRNGTEGSNFRLQLLKYLATDWFASSLVTPR